MMKKIGLMGLVFVAPLLGSGCGRGGPNAGPAGLCGPHGTTPPVGPIGGAAGMSGGLARVWDASRSSRPCSDLFDQSTVQTFSIDISADEWAKLQDELWNHLDLILQGVKFQVFHPVTFHYGAETVTDAMIRLKGQSSWYQTVTLDATHPKGQFVIAFDQVDPKKTFHGANKLDLDMPRSDWTFLHERFSNNWFRKLGIMAPCSNSARLVINGEYYGLYVNEETVGGHLVKNFFPANSNGDLWKGGTEPDTNKTMPDYARLAMWGHATDIPSMLAIIDLPASLLEWAGDALIANGDGFYGGDHNFYVYDQGPTGFVYLPGDTDATIDWLSLNSTDPNLSITDHPIYWWLDRTNTRPPLPHYLAVINDSAWRAKYVDAIAMQLDHWDVPQLQSWIDAWSAQIADAVASDPNKAAMVSDFQMAVAIARDVVAKRPAFMQSFVACERGQGGGDSDGDGVKWCDDCDDHDPAIHPGASEVCGNNLDDDCNGLVDDGCSAPPDGGPSDGGAVLSADAGVD